MFSRFLNNRGEDPFAQLHKEIGRAVEDVFRGAPWPGALGRGFAPSLEIRETPAGLQLTAELPGLTEADIDLSLDGDILTLRGEKQAEAGGDEHGVHLAERSYGRFQRSLRLPFAPDAAGVTAQFDKGVLSVALPRPAPQAAGGNRIPIRSATATPPPSGTASSAGTGSSETGAPGENQVTG